VQTKKKKTEKKTNPKSKHKWKLLKFLHVSTKSKWAETHWERTWENTGNKCSVSIM
jgi:hypothetical protein